MDPSQAVNYAASALVVIAASAPVVKCISPAPAVSHTTPAPSVSAVRALPSKPLLPLCVCFCVCVFFVCVWVFCLLFGVSRSPDTLSLPELPPLRNISGPGLQKHHQNSTKRPPEREKRTKWERERKKKERHFGRRGVRRRGVRRRGGPGEGRPMTVERRLPREATHAPADSTLYRAMKRGQQFCPWGAWDRWSWEHRHRSENFFKAAGGGWVELFEVWGGWRRAEVFKVFFLPDWVQQRFV